jgi:hypothetical protein
MGGCTNCKGKAGCDDHKGQMMGTVESALAELYPTQTWGESDDSNPSGLSADDLAGLAEELAVELTAATFVRMGGDDEPCDYIYVLCLGRAPCIVQVRDHGVTPPDEWQAAEAIEELYLRVVISQRTRVAAVQQVAVQLVRAPGGFLVRESPRAGVYDAPLLSRMQKLVAILPAYELTHVDFGDIAHAPPGFRAGVWRELYGADPSIANYLFFPQPQTMISTAFLPSETAA